MDGRRPALLRRDERLHPPGLAPSSLARDRGRAVPHRRAHRGRPGVGPRRLARRDRPAWHLATEHLRHPGGAGILLHPVLAARRGGRRGDPRRHRAHLRRRAVGTPAAGAGRAPGLGCACARVCRHRAPGAALVHDRGAGRRRGHCGRVLLRPRHDLAPPHRSRGEPRGGGAALLAGGDGYHAAARSSIVDLAGRRGAASTCSARGSAAVARSSR